MPIGYADLLVCHFGLVCDYTYWSLGDHLFHELVGFSSGGSTFPGITRLEGEFSVWNISETKNFWWWGWKRGDFLQGRAYIYLRSSRGNICWGCLRKNPIDKSSNDVAMGKWNRGMGGNLILNAYSLSVNVFMVAQSVAHLTTVRTLRISRNAVVGRSWLTQSQWVLVYDWEPNNAGEKLATLLHCTTDLV